VFHGRYGASLSTFIVVPAFSKSALVTFAPAVQWNAIVPALVPLRKMNVPVTMLLLWVDPDIPTGKDTEVVFVAMAEPIKTGLAAALTPTPSMFLVGAMGCDMTNDAANAELVLSEANQTK